MAQRGDYGVCNVCPRSKDCDYCSSGYRNDLNRGRSHDSSSDLVDIAIGVATGIVVGEIVEEVFDFFD